MVLRGWKEEIPIGELKTEPTEPLPSEGRVQLCSVQTEESLLSDTVDSLLLGYLDVFEEPRGLPSPQEFEHAIPLQPGAQPVNIRPYRYRPAQKDEIERQVMEMLEQGIIQVSASPFTSPVLLVPKKD